MRPILMVVDDDPSVLLLVDVLAEKLGFRVKAVTSGLHALEQLRDGFRPDVILLDIMMERIDGVTFLAHLRGMEEVALVPVIAMSTATVLEHYGSQLRVDGTLMKPITQQSLGAALQPYCTAASEDLEQDRS
jgi:CheY-like chemotaxis protein